MGVFVNLLLKFLKVIFSLIDIIKHSNLNKFDTPLLLRTRSLKSMISNNYTHKKSRTSLSPALTK